ncbi:hypothetical protein SY2F82_47110 [Streptomyces sp. Y2F8-2]|nr:hypothetical protein SY2F82_47110 [Streptomyces sp. Y2F8-2]
MDTLSFALGRPWHAGGDATLDPQATVRNTTLGAAIKTAPWTDMSGFSWKDDRFAEYENKGPGAGTADSDRPQLTDAQAANQRTGSAAGPRRPDPSRGKNGRGGAPDSGPGPRLVRSRVT